ncbi:MAG: hypothetical protein JXB48_05575 [Candidatus Latescibacteria bacterium]|nr:hypothetical protein [Candidatus Latescibacterota bacterium]
MKKIYQKPTIQSEKMEIGVFGCGYGSFGGGGTQWHPLFNSPSWLFFSACCAKSIF